MSLTITNYFVDFKKINKEEKESEMLRDSVLRSDMFAGDEELEEVEFLNVTEIRSGVFQDCTSLTTISFNESLKQIDANAFIGCTALQKIVFPSTLKEVEYRMGVAKLSPPSISSKTFIECLQKGYAVDLYYEGEFRDDHWD